MPNWIIGLIVAVLILVGGGYYFMSSGSLSMTESENARVGDFDGDGMPDSAVDDTNAPRDVATGQASGKLATGAFSGSWNDLVTRGGNYKCDINHAGSNDVTTGTVYVLGANVRGDFSSVVKGATTESHMLKMGEMIYVWGGGMPQGVMMKASAMTGNSSGTTQGSGVSADQSYDWNCSATGVDSSKFVKPSGIEFMDVGAMMQGGAGMMPSY